jgi:hypothetical protein
VLSLACFWGRRDLVRWLVEETGIDPSARDPAWQQRTPLEVLCELGNPLFLREKTSIAIYFVQRDGALPQHCVARLAAMLLLEGATAVADRILGMGIDPQTTRAETLCILRRLDPAQFDVTRAVDTLAS